MHLRRERDRLALAEVELPKNLAALWTQDLYPIRRIRGPGPGPVSAQPDVSIPPARQVEPKSARTEV